MRQNRWLMLCVLLMSVSLLSAQGENLLRDPGFEDTSMKVVGVEEGEGTTFSVNASWNGWYTTAPRTEEWMNRIPNGTGRNNVGFGFVRSGNRSMELSRGYATFTAAIFQTVSVPQGATVRGSAYYVMDLSEGASSQARVGVDPNGGTNPYDSDIVWSEWGGNQLASGGFRQLTATAVSTGSSVTLFLFATQRTPSAQNGIFWDDAELIVTQASGGNPTVTQAGATQSPQDTAAPIATAIPPTRVPITPQAPNPDGSIVHLVSTGETTSAIAEAYGVPLQTLLEYNPVLGDGRLIRPGQRITIKPPPDYTPSAPTTLPPVSVTPNATSVAQALPTESGAAIICVRVYEDRNANGLRDADEPSIAGGNILLEKGGESVSTYLTDGNPDPHCFENLENAEYIVVVSPPSGYTLTGVPRRLVNLQAGGTISVAFGVSASLEGVSTASAPQNLSEQTVDSDASNVQTLGLLIAAIAGGTLIVGVGVTLLMRWRYR